MSIVHYRNRKYFTTLDLDCCQSTLSELRFIVHPTQGGTQGRHLPVRRSKNHLSGLMRQLVILGSFLAENPQREYRGWAALDLLTVGICR